VNHLWVRMTLAFVGVTLVTVLIVALAAAWRGGEAFRSYVAEREESSAQEDTSQADLLPPFGRMGPRAGMGLMRGAMLPAREQDFLDQLYQLLAITAVVAGGIGAVLGLVVSRMVAAPLAGLADAARDFAARHWNRRVPVRGADEFVEVARAFNAMADDLQRAETLRRSLMADIAHELRTPLTVMQGSLRALLDGVYPLEMREIATIYDETRLLSRLVADLRELALAEAGQFSLNPQPVELLPVLRGAVEPFSLAAEAQETAIEVAETRLPPVKADPDRLAQVLHNLLANALRHTPGGRITVSGEPVGSAVQISVSDTGEGIPAGDLPFIFERFYRGDQSRSGSSGLGLAIAKAWVEAMGGKIGAESVGGQGSRFWFTLPSGETGG